MRVSFHGACQEVTGSCTLIETEKNKFIVDCGLFQGEFFSLNRNAENFSFDPKNVDFLLLTHAHADHCGRLPKLYKEGFRGKVYCTAATKDLVEVMLLDSAKIIFQEAIASNSIPLYLESDVAGILKNIVVLNYGQEKQITPEINIKMRDAGHILGSAIFEVRVKERSLEKKLVFSGDLGNTPTPILKNTELINGADYVFIESTYAGRYHESRDEGIQIIRQAILDVIKKKAVLMIPVFALEKVEEILYILNN
ncbi:MAG: MBL fold metallo-hydrolase, partial [Planctomycetes bacterium]|nr:MBL fold metallo-hydrolase [Planctomycetota bacterium]